MKYSASLKLEPDSPDWLTEPGQKQRERVLTVGPFSPKTSGLGNKSLLSLASPRLASPWHIFGLFPRSLIFGDRPNNRRVEVGTWQRFRHGPQWPQPVLCQIRLQEGQAGKGRPVVVGPDCCHSVTWPLRAAKKERGGESTLGVAPGKNTGTIQEGLAVNTVHPNIHVCHWCRLVVFQFHFVSFFVLLNV